MHRRPVFEVKDLGGADRDHICHMCGDWCSNHSGCGNRHWGLQGQWESTYPDDKYIKPGEYPVVVLICDRCFSENFAFCNGTMIELMAIGFVSTFHSK